MRIAIRPGGATLLRFGETDRLHAGIAAELWRHSSLDVGPDRPGMDAFGAPTRAAEKPSASSAPLRPDTGRATALAWRAR